MEFMLLAFTSLEKIILIIASTATGLLIIQIILLLLGFGGADIGDIDDLDPDFTGGAQLSVFTFKGIIAFLSVGGWSAFAASQAGWHIALVFIIGIACGAAAMFGIAYLYKLGMKMQYDGTLDLSKAVGEIGKVYLTVPAKGNGSGKINLTLHERYIEAEAVTESSEPIKSEEMVRVVGCLENTLIVEKYR